jgi:hypothetical protein
MCAGRARLAAAALQRLGRDVGAQDLELHVAHWLVAQRALAAAPLEALQGFSAATIINHSHQVASRL